MTQPTEGIPRVKLGGILDLVALEAAVAERLVVRRLHPDRTLAILNYTERCQYERGLWSPVTMACRGLIYNTETLEVVARPFSKFFNYGQEGAAPLDLTVPVCVTDKLDGSLGILYPVEDGYEVATRGAFQSEQAIHATDLWWERYANYTPPTGVTMLFEIVYPGNRIVVNYGERDDLILLGGVDIATGRFISLYNTLWHDWPGPKAECLPYCTLADALAAPPRPNVEGMVIVSGNDMVKIKQEDYIRLHRIVTGLNERTVWEHLSAGKPLAELLEPLPDEFHVWVINVAAMLNDRIGWECEEIERTYRDTLSSLPSDHTRKDFALAIAQHPLRSALFARLDGKDYRPGLWKAARPEAHRSPTGLAYSEDTA